MPANRKGKCDRCNKQRTDLELCGDDLLCRPCEIKNAVELTKRKLGRDISVTEGGVAGVDDGVIKPAGSECNVDVGASPACSNAYPHCSGCGSRFDELLEQLSTLMVVYGKLVEEIAELKRSVAFPVITPRDDLSPACSLSATVQSSSTNLTTKTGPSVLASVHAELAEVQRRKCNIVVYGLPNSDRVDDDCGLFLKICEENLSVKPVIVRDSCRRLGKPTVDKPRPFLVVFRNEQAAAEVLHVARKLRQSDSEYVKHNIYFNRDLTKAEAEMAYQKRVARRLRNQTQSQHRPSTMSNSSAIDTSSGLSAVATPFIPGDCDLSNPPPATATPVVPVVCGLLNPPPILTCS